MKYFSAIFFFLLFLSCAKVKMLSLDPDKETLKDHVRVITQHEYDAEKPSSRSPFTIQHSIVQFNKTGRKTDENRFDSDTNLTAMWFFSYNRKNQLTEEKWLNPDSSVAYRVEYLYNKKGQIVHERHFSTGNALENTFYYTYNNQGYVSTKSIFNKDSILIEKSSCYYLPGRVNEVVFTPEKLLKSLVSYQVDENGNVISVSEFEEEGECQESSKYTYEANGNIREVKYESIADSVYSQYFYKYEYDKNGNWTMKLELKNDIPSKIILREYGYY